MFADVKINNTTYTMTGSGRSMMILNDELNMDLFEIYTTILDGYSKKSGIPVKAKAMTALTYAFIKTANPDLFRDFDSFVAILTKPGELLDTSNIDAVMGILFDLMLPSEDLKDESATPSKKKGKAV